MEYYKGIFIRDYLKDQGEVPSALDIFSSICYPFLQVKKNQEQQKAVRKRVICRKSYREIPEDRNSVCDKRYHIIVRC